MSFRGEDSGPADRVEQSLPVRIVKAATSVSLTILIVSLVALMFAPKDPGTLTMYGLVIGGNLLLFLAFWPTVKWLRRLGQ